MSPWSSGDSLSPSILNLRQGAATLPTGFSTNSLQAESGSSVNIFSDVSTGLLAASKAIQVGGLPSSTSGLFSLRANSLQSDYIFLQDSTGLKSNFLLGLRTGDGSSADGLNLYDTSHTTLIARFSSDSIRFFKSVVGPVFDSGGALASTYNAAIYAVGLSKESQIQAAITAAAVDGIKRVYVPASLYPYNATAISFDTRVQMVREGGNWSVFDVLAYGASGNSGINDAPAIDAAIRGAAPLQQTVYFPAGSYVLTSPVTYATGVRFEGGSFNISAGTTAVALVSRIAAGGFTILPPASGAPFNGTQFINLKIIVDTSSNAAIGGIDLTGASACVLDNIFVSTLDGATVSNGEGIRLNVNGPVGGLYNVLQNVTLSRMGWGVRCIGGATNMNWFKGTRTSSCSTGIALQGNHNVLFGPDFELATHGLVIGAGGGTGSHTILSPNFDTVSTAITDSGTSGSWIIGPTFSAVTTPLVGGFLSQIVEWNTAWPNNDLTFSNSTITTDASVGKFFRLIATNTSAFTINNPVNGKDGQELVYLIRNGSGSSVLGAITWDTQFQLAGNFVAPANTKQRSIHFQRYAAKWWEISRSQTDLG